jgi:predicted lipid-binding transport protein (Tim44 family)
MGPLAGLAAGLGIAALLSHFGLGGALADLLTMVLIGVALFFAVRWLLRRFAPGAQRMQFAGTPVRAATPLPASAAAGAGAAATATATAASAPTDSASADFDHAAFERIAKLIFIRLQAANDSADVQDLRRFTTPQMFAEVQLELQQRGSTAQRTDVVRLDAEVLDKAEEDGQQVVSVRFHGLIREEHEAPAAPFDETWHFVRPLDGSREWAIAGIAQNA